MAEKKQNPSLSLVSSPDVASWACYYLESSAASLSSLTLWCCSWGSWGCAFANDIPQIPQTALPDGFLEGFYQLGVRRGRRHFSVSSHSIQYSPVVICPSLHFLLALPEPTSGTPQKYRWDRGDPSNVWTHPSSPSFMCLDSCNPISFSFTRPRIWQLFPAVITSSFP